MAGFKNLDVFNAVDYPRGIFADVDADAMMYARPPVPVAIGDAITRGTETYRVTKLRTYVGHGVTALVKAELKWAS